MVNVGEQLRVTPEIRWLSRQHPGLVLENHYGPTETHEVASYTLSGSPDDFPTLPPIGTAIDGATISLLDADLRPVPPGTKGEIYVGVVASPSVIRERPRPHSGAVRHVRRAPPEDLSHWRSGAAVAQR